MDRKIQERSRFLLSLVPSLTAVGSFQYIYKYSEKNRKEEALDRNNESLVFDFQKLLRDIIGNKNVIDVKGLTEVTETSWKQLTPAFLSRTCNQIL